jgi:hypothetical protein
MANYLLKAIFQVDSCPVTAKILKLCKKSLIVIHQGRAFPLFDQNVLGFTHTEIFINDNTKKQLRELREWGLQFFNFIIKSETKRKLLLKLNPLSPKALAPVSKSTDNSTDNSDFTTCDSEAPSTTVVSRNKECPPAHRGTRRASRKIRRENRMRRGIGFVQGETLYPSSQVSVLSSTQSDSSSNIKATPVGFLSTTELRVKDNFPLRFGDFSSSTDNSDYEVKNLLFRSKPSLILMRALHVLTSTPTKTHESRMEHAMALEVILRNGFTMHQSTYFKRMLTELYDRTGITERTIAEIKIPRMGLEVTGMYTQEQIVC